MPTIRTILHPTDFSSCSNRAYELACQLARDSGARLVSLHVKPLPAIDPVDVEYDFAIDEFEEPDSETFVEDVELGPNLAAFAEPVPHLSIERRVECGDPASEILRVIHEISADLVVLGTHGTTASDRTLLGGVARRVLGGVPCAVITVDPPPRKRDRANERHAQDSPAWADHPAA